MRNIIVILITVLAFAGAYPQEKQEHKLEVSGKAEILAPADQAVFSASVTGFGSTLRGAVEQAKNKAAQISKKLQNLGLKESCLQTSYFYSGENFGGKAFFSSTKDFKASITVNITIDTLPLLEEAILNLSESEVSNISNITFKLKNFESIKEKARIQAIENAKAKALQMAGLLNIKLSSVIDCGEGDAYQPFYAAGPNPFNTSTDLRALDSERGSGFYAQSVSINANIRLVYEIQPAK